MSEKKKILLVLTMLPWLCPCMLNAMETHVGSIKTVKGDASIVRNSKPVAAVIGARVYRNDTLKTGAHGSLAMVFRDDTLLSIGPGSEIKKAAGIRMGGRAASPGHVFRMTDVRGVLE